MGTETSIYGDKDIFMGTKTLEVVLLSLMGWLIGILLAPVFITIGLGVLVISGLFDGVEWDE